MVIILHITVNTWVGKPKIGYQDEAFLPSKVGFCTTFIKIAVEVTYDFGTAIDLWFGLGKGMFFVRHLA